MKNVILGMIGGLIIIYTSVLSLSVYSVCIRKNQMEKCLSAALMSAMNRYYKPNMYSFENTHPDSSVVEMELVTDIEDRLSADTDIDTTIYICDMEKGIISAEIVEEFELPMGFEKKISCSKTIIADKEMEN